MVLCIQLSAQNVRRYYYYFHELNEKTEAFKSEGTGLPNTTLGVGNWIKPEVFSLALNASIKWTKDSILAKQCP